MLLSDESQPECVFKQQNLKKKIASCSLLLNYPAKCSFGSVLGMESTSVIFSLPLCFQVLICRNYMGDMDMHEIDHFMPILMKREEEAETTPLVSHGPAHFLWIKHNNLYRIRLSLFVVGLEKIPVK